MNKSGPHQTLNSSEIVTRTILKEELSKFERKFEQKIDLKFDVQDEKFDKKLKKNQNEILGRFDDIVGQLKDMREANTITGSLHRRVLDLEDKTDILESIHPHGQHAPS